MKKSLIILIIALTLSLFGVEVGKSSISVTPAELSITMSENLIQGNTSKKITINLDEIDSYNVSWYVEHPTPIDKMRPNKIKIPDLSWVDVDPAWSIIPAYGSADFYVHLSIPEQDEVFDKHWETWVTFTFENIESGNLIIQELAVRVYIDTPAGSQVNNSNDKINDSASKNPTMQPLIIIGIAIIAIIAISVSVLLLRKPKK